MKRYIKKRMNLANVINIFFNVLKFMSINKRLKIIGGPNNFEK